MIYTPTNDMRTGSLITGQFTGSELALSIAALFLGYHLFVKPRLSATYAARTALSAKEKEKMKTLELENQELSDIVDSFVCAARGVGQRTGTSCK